MTFTIKSKLLSDTAWKEVVAKNKGIKDNGLLKSLAGIRQLGEDDHDDAQKTLDEIVKLAAQLKKSKEIAASPAVVKFLAELSGAADTAMKDVVKAKAEAGKKAKADDEAKKREAEQAKKGGKEEGEDEEEGEVSALLTTKLIPLLRQVAKGEVMHALVASTGKKVAVMLSRKPISPARRKLLADELGNAGGIKYYVGHCLKEGGATTFVLKTQVAGLAKKLKLALMEQTGLRVKKLSCRGEDGEMDLDEDEQADDSGDAGDGDEERPRARRGEDEGERLERRANKGGDEDEADEAEDEEEAADDKGGRASAKSASSGPAGAPSPALVAAPDAWDEARSQLRKNIESLKSAVQAQTGDEDSALVDEIAGHLKKLDRILGKLDRRLADSLSEAAEAKSAEDRGAAIDASKRIIAEYFRYVQSEPLIAHLDGNPFGVKTKLGETLMASLAKMARAVA